MNNDWTSRKFLLVIILIAIATVAMFLSKCNFEAWSIFAGSITGLYSGINTWEKKIQGKTNGNGNSTNS